MVVFGELYVNFFQFLLAFAAREVDGGNGTATVLHLLHHGCHFLFLHLFFVFRKADHDLHVYDANLFQDPLRIDLLAWREQVLKLLVEVFHLGI